MADSGDWRVLMAGAAIKGASTALVKAYFDGYVVPFLRGMVPKKTETELKASLNRYVRYMEAKTRVLPSLARVTGPLNLEDVYEPLTIVSDNGEFTLTVNSYPRDLFEHGRCIALTDDAGMGKSTLAKYIARSAIIESQSIPLFIELRRLRAGTSILSVLCNELVQGGVESDKGKDLISMLSKGRFIFILDGFDEVEESVRPDLVAEINDLSARFEFCYFVLTSRPEYSVSLFPDYSRVGICKLTEAQAYSLIRRIDGAKGLAKTLIHKISVAQIDEFLGNPLLVTLLYRAFDHRNSVPPKRTMFFRQVYDALFEDHDLSKGDAYARNKECGLDKEDFHKLVRSLGFETLKSSRTSYANDELERHIKTALGRCDIKSDHKKIKNDLLKSVPLFVRDGVEIRWCHKAFQEYFASQYILSDMGSLRESLVLRMFESQDAIKYREIFRFIGEADIGLLRSTCIEPFLSESYRKSENDEDFPISCLHDAVDIFYVGDVGKNEDHIDVVQCVLGRFDIDLSSRLTSMVVDWANGFVLIAALKERGTRYLLLTAMDQKQFPPYKSSNRTALAKAWNNFYGKAVFHVNKEKAGLFAILEQLGSIEHLEAASCLNLIPANVLADLRRSGERRKAALAPSVLDGF